MSEPTELHRIRLERDDDVLYAEWMHRGETDRRPVVVLTHGAGGSHAVWYAQVPTLSRQFRVLTWDSRGFGNSSCRDGTLSLDGAVADLAALLDHLGVVDPVHLVGQSMGGWWVTAFALAHPESVRSLTLSDTPGGIWTSALKEHFANFRRDGGSLASDRVGFHPALGQTTMARSPEVAFLYQEFGSFHDPPMAEVGRVLATADVPTAAIRALDRPLLVIAGEEDTIFPAPLLKALASEIDAAYVELSAAGHSPYFETPDAYNDALTAFLAHLGSS